MTVTSIDKVVIWHRTLTMYCHIAQNISTDYDFVQAFGRWLTVYNSNSWQLVKQEHTQLRLSFYTRIYTESKLCLFGLSSTSYQHKYVILSWLTQEVQEVEGNDALVFHNASHQQQIQWGKKKKILEFCEVNQLSSISLHLILPASVTLFPWHAYVEHELFLLVRDRPAASAALSLAVAPLPLLLLLWHQTPARNNTRC